MLPESAATSGFLFGGNVRDIIDILDVIVRPCADGRKWWCDEQVVMSRSNQVCGDVRTHRVELSETNRGHRCL